MSTFSAVGSTANTDATTLLYFANKASTFRRLKAHEVIIGSDAVPVEQSAAYQIRRITDENVTPGGDSVTPFVWDEDQVASIADAISNPSGEPTYAAGAGLEIGLTQRGTFRWVAQPFRELVCSALEDHGWATFMESVTTAFNANVTMVWDE